LQKEDTLEVLKHVFGHSGFRPLQKEAVEAVLLGRDLLMVLPTGGGKSLCYQLPALLKEGVTIVISPLLALMQDQVRALKLQGVEAEMIGSMQSGGEIAEIMGRLRNAQIKLLYVAPERFSSPGFVELLKGVRVASFVIDEAHCVSEWGHEFREDYRRLHLLKELFPKIPVSAFTATATPQVEEDIAMQLGLDSPVRLRGSVYRQNLLVRAEPRSGPCGPRAFVHDETDVMVATVAFGMGIDKSNIRFVVHMSMPKTLESYYQEIGRAGRRRAATNRALLQNWKRWSTSARASRAAICSLPNISVRRWSLAKTTATTARLRPAAGSISQRKQDSCSPPSTALRRVSAKTI